jgi:hypothetical protein
MASDPTHWLFVARIVLVMATGIIAAAHERHHTRQARRERRRRDAEFRAWASSVDEGKVA